MQKLIVALCLSGAAAYVAPVAPSAGSKLAASKDEVVALAEANPDFLGKAIGFWDPLGALDTNFWGLGNEGTIGYLRHAEIKHGRVAMAGFLGYLAGSTELVSGPHKILPYRGAFCGVVFFSRVGAPRVSRVSRSRRCGDRERSRRRRGRGGRAAAGRGPSDAEVAKGPRTIPRPAPRRRRDPRADVRGGRAAGRASTPRPDETRDARAPQATSPGSRPRSSGTPSRSTASSRSS